LVKIRLTRGGRKKRPFYRIVAADSRMPRDGRFLEVLGHYNPISDPKEFKIKTDRLNHWVEQGALLSDTVASLLKKFPTTEAAE
jgi:small subunit ribosomal protein S16